MSNPGDYYGMAQTIAELEAQVDHLKTGLDRALNAKFELEEQLAVVRGLQRYEVEPDMMEGNPPVCWTPDDEGEGIKFDELQAALNGEGE